ncbi:flagellar hook-associated protein FlgK [Leptospira sp. GIMC2001]|uniref:flagellar hook-associated protein FlgK n=1 Tax=Leptospira sp. GIMC2001 TaxID=1513297 RepID=UPI0004A5C5BA|nr:flagellar hook-associated protein FlgK [Leptospira sp. GIMC2001]AID56216.1 flagellar hook-associated protein FlgK [Leptospira sp. GIMC2001]WCL50060.1 flagellar hook-associated protein FlgK [Leptospira sp. GIMC2001]
MGSTFSGIELGKRGLSTHQQALQTTGHNISNADNKHYARQRVNITSSEPIYEPSMNRAHVAGQIGQGSDVRSIERVRDNFIDDRIIETSSQKEYWAKKSSYLGQMETVFNEPTGNTLRTMMDSFWSSWEDLANYPEDNAHRSVVLEKATGLGSRMEDVHRKLSQLQNQSNREVEAQANKLNGIAESIRNLNERIGKAEALGDMPNDLYDRRDELLQELSGMVDINIGRGDKDELMVFIGQQILVQGQKRENIEIVGSPAKDGMFDLRWEKSGNGVLLKTGSLQALMEIRDKVIVEKIAQVDALAINTMDVVNQIHRDGFGLNGSTNLDFFETRSLSNNSFGEVDTDGDGQLDKTAIFRVSGRTSLDPDRPIGISGSIKFIKPGNKEEEVLVPYSVDDTMNDVIKRINRSETGVVAYMNQDNQLTLKATTVESNPKQSFQIRHLEDSGELLVGMSGILFGSGAAGAFDSNRLSEINKFQSLPEDIALTPHYHPSSFFKMSAAVLNNPANLAAARGKDVGGTGDYNSPNGHKDGSNALLIAASLREKPVMFDYSKTTDDFYNSLISKLGTEASEANQEVATQSDLMVELENMRQSVMGVNLDEEMANMVQFQHSYNAAAKMLQTMNEMLETIINRLGA